MTTGFESFLQPKAQPPASYRWGTVTTASPLAVQLDGDSTPLPIAPASLCGRLAVGDRVWCQIYNRQVVVLGRKGGMLDRWVRVGASERATSTATSPGTTAVYNMGSITIPQALCVTGMRFRITAHGHTQGDTLNAYCDIQSKLGVSAAVGGTQIGGTYAHQYIAAGRQIPFSFTHEYVYGSLSESEGLTPYNLVLTGQASTGNSFGVASATRKIVLFLDWLAT